MAQVESCQRVMDFAFGSPPGKTMPTGLRTYTGLADVRGAPLLTRDHLFRAARKSSDWSTESTVARTRPEATALSPLSPFHVARRTKPPRPQGIDAANYPSVRRRSTKQPRRMPSAARPPPNVRHQDTVFPTLSPSSNLSIRPAVSAASRYDAYAARALSVKRS